MEITKTCFKCNVDKPLTEYYKHKQMGDGYLGKCKDCAKLDVKARENTLLSDPEWVEKEKTRARDKYYRLGYKDKHKPTPEKKKEIMDRYKSKYPEKAKARSHSAKIKSTKGHNHHWSYNEEHWMSLIDISGKDHAKAHRFIVYDPERMMYRRSDNNVLLDTKEAHEEYIYWCINNK